MGKEMHYQTLHMDDGLKLLISNIIFDHACIFLSALFGVGFPRCPSYHS